MQLNPTFDSILAKLSMKATAHNRRATSTLHRAEPFLGEFRNDEHSISLVTRKRNTAFHGEGSEIDHERIRKFRATTRASSASLLAIAKFPSPHGGRACRNLPRKCRPLLYLYSCLSSGRRTATQPVKVLTMHKLNSRESANMPSSFPCYLSSFTAIF